MFRFILPAIGLLLILTAIVYFLIFFKKPTESTLATASTSQEQTASPVPLTAPDVSSPLPSTANANEKLLDNRLTIVEKSLAALTAQVTALSLKSTPAPNVSTTAPPSPIAKPSQYITLGTNAIYNNQGYTSIPGFTATLNPTDFPGYTYVTLEATFSRVQLGGTGSLQLYNQTTGQPITASNISTTSTSYQLVSSAHFQLATGTNTYALQLQSSDNTNIQVSIARLKVSYN